MKHISTRYPRVLVVDDDIFVREMIGEILEDSGFKVTQAEHGREALEIFTASTHDHIDLIVSDINMPEMNGLELVDSIRATDKDTPIIILTVNSEIDTAVKAIRKGADDYILKGSAIGDTLPLSVAKVLEFYDLKIQNRELILDLSRKNSELERLAFLDGLTGISNRRYYDATLDSEWQSALKKHQYISMIMTDIDKFKELNDTLGHQYGDLCIQGVAKTLSSVLRSADAVLARYGGDEFIAVLPNTDPDTAGRIAEKMRSRVEQLVVIDPESGSSKPITMSFGVYGLIPEVSSDPEELFEGADKALYTAKESGRNRVEIRQ